ncbi:TPA: DinI-like family protein [Yersinia enterocolitica]|uniref:DinI-like family protein n=1 Tax=Yersinia enterocolitica TaxID=630 RepID=UPI0021E82671|nr:DinI-like family protein [Yersinia enterocolitica]UYK05159.1 DinI-like family protein [Yersinia enterocolitica]HDL7377986.1 DinI-like family protein [Yersinia enterocolitica]HDL7386879.1 DinI-like family protein [Yersinia enterocolitica]HDL7399576.1 DinI-like family protein [Yersinia enterocolitica]HDM8089088.1 DinI-like family protein [Yersinia enterocolitica]
MLRIEVTIDKLNAKSFPVGYTDALTEELMNRLSRKFGEVDVKVRFAGADGLTVLGGASEDKKTVEEILQDTWESADDWFQP